MTTEAITSATEQEQAPGKPAPAAHRQRLSAGGFLIPLGAAIALAIHCFVPDQQISVTKHYYPLLLGITIVIGLCAALVQLLRPAQEGVRQWIAHRAALMCGAFMALAVWDLVTLKQMLAPMGIPLPLPYFPGPDLVIQSVCDDWRMLLDCSLHSALLLLCGYMLGAILGVISGVLIGWSSKWRYWGMPVLKLIGPIPATAFIPLALMLFPTAFISAIALIAIAVWFPVTMLTASGVANVRISLLDVARTLGAKPAFLVFRVAIPAAMPNIFVGLFMGLGTSFLTLVVAETVGVSSGLGWYINWAKAWADYPKVYAALVIMAVFFSGIMTLLFKVRDRALVYQKGTIKW
jgi:NitT/TauT family transport system permease protein